LKKLKGVAALSWGEEDRTMAGLCGVFVDRATARDALARRQFGTVFDGTHQQIERVHVVG